MPVSVIPFTEELPIKQCASTGLLVWQEKA